jgi:hypothetical protein
MGHRRHMPDQENGGSWPLRLSLCARKKTIAEDEWQKTEAHRDHGSQTQRRDPKQGGDSWKGGQVVGEACQCGGEAEG